MPDSETERPQKKKPEFVPTNVILTRPLLNAIDEIAEETAVNRSVIVREAVRQFVTLKKAA